MFTHNKNKSLPFSLISGQGLGVSHSSFQSLDSFLPARALGQGEVNCHLNLASGNVNVCDRLLSFPDIGDPIEFAYRYNSLDKNSSWRLTFGRQIKSNVDKNVITLIEADGHEVEYGYDQDNDCYTASTYQNGKAKITYENDHYTCYHPDSNLTECFDKEGHLLTRTDGEGHQTSYHYEAGKIKKIIAPSGTTYTFHYEKEKLEIFRNENVLLHTYLLDERGQLKKSKTRDQYEINYNYSSDNKLHNIKQTDGSSLTFDYYGDEINSYKIKFIQEGDSKSLHTIRYNSNFTIFKDESGTESVLTFNDQRQPIWFISDNEQTQYQFNEHNQLEKIIFPDKSEENYEYNAKSGLPHREIKRDGTSIIYNYTDSNKPLLISKTHFANNNANEVTYPSIITRYVYDENFNGRFHFLRYEISGEGRVKEHLPNANGLVEQTVTYLTDFYPVDKNATLLDLDNWKKELSEQNPLNREVTYFEYEQGQIKSIKKLMDADGNTAEMHLEHDIRGNLTHEVKQYNQAESSEKVQRFDDLSRPTYSCIGKDPTLKQETTHHYQNNTKTTTFPSITHHTEISTFNSQGLLETKTENVRSEDKVISRTHGEHYDEKEKVTILTHPDQQKSYIFYDNQGRIAATVSPTGALTYYEHHKKCRYETKTEYAQTINTKDLDSSPNLLQLIKKIEPDPEQDRTSVTFYNYRDLPQFQIDAKGYVIEFRYHLTGLPTHTITYQTKITEDELVLLKKGLAIHRHPDRTIDRIHSYFYDKDGLNIAEQDPAGFITEFKRNAGGKITEEIQYAHPNLSITDDFSSIKSDYSENDAKQVYYYNAAQQLILEVNAEGFITTHTYELDGKEKSSRRYATKVDKAWYANTTLPPQPILDETHDQEIKYEYDELRRLINTEDSTGKMTIFTHDVNDNQIACYQHDKDELNKISGDHHRGVESRFDDWGHEIAHTNAFVTEKLADIDRSDLPLFEKEKAKEKIWKDHAFRYEYNDAGLKVKARDPYGKFTWFFYDKNKQPVLSIDASGAVVENHYNRFGEVILERNYYQFLSADVVANLTGGYLNEDIRNAIIAHEKDEITRFKRDQRGQITEKIDAMGNVSQYDYDAFKQCVIEKLPVNDSLPSLAIEHHFESRGHEIKTVKKAPGLNSITTQQKYDHYFGKLTDDYDEVGGHTNYLHDRLGNKVITKKRMDSDTYLITEKKQYNAFGEPIKITNADQQTSFIEYNPKKRTKEITHSGDESKTTIQHNIFGQAVVITEGIKNDDTILTHNEFLHAADGQLQTHRKDHEVRESKEFDLLGHTEMTFDADGVKTQYVRNDVYQVIGEVFDSVANGLQLKTYDVNALGQIEKITDARGIITRKEYDLNGHLKQSVRDPGDHNLNITENFAYNAQGNRTDSIQGDKNTSNQYHKKKEWDEFNRLKAVIIDPITDTYTEERALSIRNEFTYNAANKLIKETNPNGHVIRQYYDLLQRKRFKITELDENKVSGLAWEYTPAGNLKSLCTFHLPVEQSVITDETNLNQALTLFKTSVDDTVTLYFQDEKGRDRYKIRIIYDHEKQQFQGLVEEKRYNSLDLVTQKINYASPIFDSDYEKWTTRSITQCLNANKKPEDDRVVYHWYNKNNQCCLTVDQNGFAIEKRRDKSDRVISEIQYDHPIKDIATLSSQNLESVLKHITPHPQKDRVKHFIYDKRRLRFEVNPGGLVRRQDYDENDNIISVCEFKDRVLPAANYEALVQTVNQLKPDEKKDSITTTRFDHADDIHETQDAHQKIDTYHCNALGKTTLHQDRNRQTWGFEHDRANRLIRETSPQTTITTVHRNEGGELISEDIKDQKVIKKIDFDKVGNAITITEGEGLKEERVCHFTYDANKNPTSVRIENVEIDDPEKPADYQHPDLKSLPVKVTTLTTEIIYNTKNKKIAEKNEKGKWSYFIYDAAERLIFLAKPLDVENTYSLYQLSRNAFDQVECERSYITPFTFNFDTYRKTRSIDIKPFIEHPKLNQDRIKITEFCLFGQEKNSKTGEVFYFSEDEQGRAQPETKYEYNSFHEPIYEAKLIRPNVWAENYFFRDRCGKMVAEVDETNYLTLYERNAHGDVISRTEYATPIKDISTRLSLDELRQKAIPSEKDRVYQIDYDQRHQPIKETLFVRNAQGDLVNPMTQQRTKDVLPQFENVQLESSKAFSYTPTQQLASRTFEDGGKAFNYYDERGLLIGETDVSRQTIHGKEDTITPFTRKKVNAFGQTVVTQTSTKGSTSPTENKLPDFIDPDAIHEEISLMDKCGLTQIKQDAEKNKTAFTYTPSRKVARELQPVSLWHRAMAPALEASVLQPEEKEDDWELVKREKKENLTDNWFDVEKESNQEIKDEPLVIYKGRLEGLVDIHPKLNDKVSSQTAKATFNRIKVLDEKKITYNASDKPVQLDFLRNGEVEERIYSQYNVFGDFIAEGTNKENLASQRKIDNQGKIWYSNGEKGAPTLLLYDLRGFQTLKLQAANDDLNQISYDNLEKPLEWDAKRLERNETLHDKAGNFIASKAPIWFRDKNALPTRQYEVDRWRNVTKEINSLGYVTESEYNHHNDLIKCIQPETDIVHADGTSVRERPITTYAHTPRGFYLGSTDANHHTTSFQLDEAGQWLTQVAADGVIVEKQVLNAFGLPVETMDERGGHWLYHYNKLGKLAVTQFPSGLTARNIYDEKGGLSSTIAPSQSPLFYNNDVRGNVWERYLPCGQLTRTKYDHNGQPLVINNADGSGLVWQRDYFGNPESHLDLAGRNTTYRYDHKMQLLHVAKQPQWLSAHLTSQISGSKTYPYVTHKINYLPAHAQDIEYYHSYGNLDRIDDRGLLKSTLYQHNTEGRPTQVDTYDPTGLIYSLHTKYDELGRESNNTNQHQTHLLRKAEFNLQTRYDAVGNRRHLHAELKAPGYPNPISCFPPIKVQDDWHRYDDADRILVHAGGLTGGHIQIRPGRGIAFDYENGMRKHEHSQEVNGAPVSTELNYEVDGMLSTTQSSTGVYTKRNLDADKWIGGFIERYPGHETEHQFIVDDNRWVKNEVFFDNNILQNQKTYSYYDVGVPNNERNEIYRKDHTLAMVENRQHEYEGFDSFVPRKVSGSYTIYDAKGHPTTGRMSAAEFFFDANGAINGKKNSTDEPHAAGRPLAVYQDTTTDGLIVNKQLSKTKKMPHGPPRSFDVEYNFLHNANSELEAGYSIEYTNTNQTKHKLFHQHHIGKDVFPEISDLVIQSPIHPVGRTTPTDKKAKNEPLNWDELNPQLGPQFYTVEQGDSLEKIAIALYGNVHAAKMLAKFNGLLSTEHSLKAGHILRVPMYIPTFNKAGEARPYQQFKSIVIGALSPRLIVVQPIPHEEHAHGGFFSKLVKIIALGIVFSVVGSVVAPFLLTSSVFTALGLTGPLVEAVTTGVLAAIGDAAVQGVAIGLGVQSDFSMAEVLETGVSAGTLNYLGELKTLDPIKVAKRALKVGASVTTTQLIEMKAGLRDKFDARAVALQVTASIASHYINAGVEKITAKFGSEFLSDKVSNTLTTTTNALLGHAVTGAPIDIEGIAANVVGSAIGNEISKNIAPQVPVINEPENDISDHTPSSHDIAREEAIAFSKVDDPTLPAFKPRDGVDDPTLLPTFKPRYGEISYKLSEMNRTSMNLTTNDAWMERYKNYDLLNANRAERWNAPSKSLVGLMWDKVKRDAKAIYESGKEFVRNPSEHLLKSSIASFQEKGTLLFNTASVNAGNFHYQPVDSETQRMLVASTVATFGEQALFFAVAGVAVGRVGLFCSRVAGGESLGYDSVAFRQARMLEKNSGYNISPESWFTDFNSLGREGTFITDYRAIGEILGPIRADAQFNVGFFSRGNTVSYFKIGKLEQVLGLERGSLSDGFRFSRISKIDQMHPRSPLVGNSLFTKPGQGLPHGGPELVIDSVSTNPWPRRMRHDD